MQPSLHFVSETLLSPRPYKTPSPAKRTAPKVSFAGSSGKLGVSKSRLARLMKQRKINAPRCEGLSVRAVRDISPAQSLGQPASCVFYLGATSAIFSQHGRFPQAVKSPSTIITSPIFVSASASSRAQPLQSCSPTKAWVFCRATARSYGSGFPRVGIYSNKIRLKGLRAGKTHYDCRHAHYRWAFWVGYRRRHQGSLLVRIYSYKFEVRAVGKIVVRVFGWLAGW